MDATERGPTTHTSDSSNAEPVAVRRRVDIDGNFTSTRQQPRDVLQVPRLEEAHADDTYCDESLFHATNTPQQDPNIDVASNGSKDHMSFVAEDSKMSNTGRDPSNQDTGKTMGTDEKYQIISVRSNISFATGDGQQQNDVVVRETSENFNTGEQGDTSEKDTCGTSEKCVSLESHCNSDSQTEAPNMLSSFGGSSYSLIELSLAYDNALESMEQEKKREEEVFSAISTHMARVSNLTGELYNVARDPFGDSVPKTASPGLRNLSGCDDRDSTELELRLTAVCDLCNETIKHTEEGNLEQAVNLVISKPITSNSGKLTDTSSSDDDHSIFLMVREAGCNTVRKASNLVRKSRNAVLRQRIVMTKLCAVAERLVSKTEISYGMIRNCLKTIVVVVMPAVRTNRLMERAVRKLESEGKGLTAFSDAASSTAKWTSDAVRDAEAAVSVYEVASEALEAARGNLDAMLCFQRLGADVFRRIRAAGDRFLELIQKSNAALDEIMAQESEMRRLRACLLPVLERLKNYRMITQQWSTICSDTVPVMLETLSLASRSSCNAIEASLRAVQDTLVPAGISFKGNSK